jgi:hypothetical protein
MDVVSEEALSALLPDGRVVPIHIRVGRPRPRPTGEWACPVDAEGLPGWQGSRDIFGEGSLQALMLGLGLLRSVLLDATARGTVFRWPDSEEVFHVELLFWTDAST